MIPAISTLLLILGATLASAAPPTLPNFPSTPSQNLTFTSNHVLNATNMTNSAQEPWPDAPFEREIYRGSIEIIHRSPFRSPSPRYTQAILNSIDAISHSESPIDRHHQREKVTSKIHAVDGDVTLDLWPLEPDMDFYDGAACLKAVAALYAEYGRRSWRPCFLGGSIVLLVLMFRLIRGRGREWTGGSRMASSVFLAWMLVLFG